MGRVIAFALSIAVVAVLCVPSSASAAVVGPEKGETIQTGDEIFLPCQPTRYWGNWSDLPPPQEGDRHGVSSMQSTLTWEGGAISTAGFNELDKRECQPRSWIAEDPGHYTLYTMTQKLVAHAHYYYTNDFMWYDNADESYLVNRVVEFEVKGKPQRFSNAEREILSELAEDLDFGANASGVVAVVAGGIATFAATYVSAEVAFAVGVVAAVEGLSKVSVERLAKDPPDFHYKRVVRPPTVRVPVVPAGGPISQAGADALNAYLGDLASASSFVLASVTAAERSMGAQLRHNHAWSVRQLRASKRFAGKAAQLFDLAEGLATNARSALLDGGLVPLDPTLDGGRAVKDLVGTPVTSGSSADYDTAPLPSTLEAGIAGVVAPKAQLARLRGALRSSILRSADEAPPSFPDSLIDPDLALGYHDAADALRAYAGDSAADDDADGVTDGRDLCPRTGSGSGVDADGCSPTQLDSDRDGVSDADDLCPETDVALVVDGGGCTDDQKADDDADSVQNWKDECPDTPVGDIADADGCAPSQRDTDGDGVTDDLDLCPATPPDEAVDAQGCP